MSESHWSLILLFPILNSFQFSTISTRSQVPFPQRQSKTQWPPQSSSSPSSPNPAGRHGLRHRCKLRHPRRQPPPTGPSRQLPQNPNQHRQGQDLRRQPGHHQGLRQHQHLLNDHHPQRRNPEPHETTCCTPVGRGSRQAVLSQTKINYIAMGNEVLHWGDDNLKNSLVPAMRTFHNALVREGIKDVKVSTPHSLGIMLSSEPPSQGRFRPEVIPLLTPMLGFLRQTKGPFMVNPYPYFGWSPEKENYALFKPNKGVHDQFTGKSYTNMFDGLMDAVYSAAKAVGFGDVDLVAAETGWPSSCEFPVCSVQNAVDYNGHLIKHVESGKGTPLMPNRKFDTYIFALFNENQKPGPLAEKNWGLFKPDMTPVYNAGVMRNQQGGATPGPMATTAPQPATPATPAAPAGPAKPVKGGKKPKPATPAAPVAAGGGKKWCVAKPGATNQALQANIDYVCGKGVDCKPIQPGGTCFDNDVKVRASYLMNAYYQANGRHDFNCDFSKTGQLTSADPSHGSCKYNA
ncbi:glucan endo-1 3-beta-glucosidase [Prunus yedoensis var. nudiflora]|uniref:glucan endo-1,3-beta-D-glucosidase n=1 Tax=Prunus yedoensis var. nudiflora TaxID=2094558 RepID=A0A314YKG9_PRUYE|nr:glucan endo-1 3-beta-glucosidase [Prunus yedoensis var. nudiflora]